MAQLSIAVTSKFYGKVGGKFVADRIWVKNSGARLVKVTRVYLKPDWLEKEYWYKEPSAKISPEGRKKFKFNGIEIPLHARVGTHKLKIGIWYSILQDSGWSEVYGLEVSEDSTLEISKAPDLSYKVFVSHSNSQLDKTVIDSIESCLNGFGVSTFVAEKINQAGDNLWSKIRNGIDESDCVVVVWSKDGSESGDVREEIGYAFGKEKKVIPISETELKGSIKGSEYMKLDRGHLSSTLDELAKKIHSLAIGKTQIASTSDATSPDKPPKA